MVGGECKEKREEERDIKRQNGDSPHKGGESILRHSVREETAFYELPLSFRLYSFALQSVMVGESKAPVKCLELRLTLLQGNLKQDLSHETPCHPRAVRLTPRFLCPYLGS